MLNFAHIGNFVVVKTTYYDDKERKLKTTQGSMLLNIRHVESLSRGQDVSIDGILYKYYNILTTSQHFGCISSDLDMFFEELK